MTITVYTDGACSGNPGPGGWAWAVSRDEYASGPAAHTTNQRMEITAAAEAVQALGGQGDLVVVSDSQYVVKCFTDRWWQGWQRRGWVNAQKKPVANRDLWEPFIAAVNAHGSIQFRWVKGHSGNRMNDFVDQLAVEAGARQVARASGA